MAAGYLSTFLLYFIVFNPLRLYLANEICISSSSCLCNMKDDKYIDISNITNGQKKYLTVNSSEYNYYFSGCSYVNMKLPIPENATNNCFDSAFCIFNKNTNVSINFGRTVGIFKEANNHEIGYQLNTKKGTDAFILLGCTNVEETYLVPDAINATTHNLVLFSPHACPMVRHHDHGSLSTGSVLLIILFVSLTVYLVGGALVLHFVRGARGKEMIPNYDFWCGLPSLVRDGMLFLLNGCNPVIVPTADSYDRI